MIPTPGASAASAPTTPIVTSVAPTPSATVTSPVPTPSAVGVVPSPAPRPAGPSAYFGPRPAPLHPPMGPPRKGPPFPRRAGPPRPPPTKEQVSELAHREHVPFRIAKGDLEGKMKARIWRKLHAEEARRFDQAYELMGKTPGLELPDAFGLVQSGMSLEDFKARRARAQRKTAVREARTSVTPEAVDAFLQGLKADAAELSIVLGERTLLDTLKDIQPVAFVLEKVPRLEKLQVVLLARRSIWEKLSPTMERDAKTAQKPAAVAREPDKRPVSDPRDFLDLIGLPVRLSLRNGLQLTQKLLAVGPFDLLLGTEAPELFVPLHAIVRWETT